MSGWGGGRYLMRDRLGGLVCPEARIIASSSLGLLQAVGGRRQAGLGNFGVEDLVKAEKDEGNRRLMVQEAS